MGVAAVKLYIHHTEEIWGRVYIKHNFNTHISEASRATDYLAGIYYFENSLNHVSLNLVWQRCCLKSSDAWDAYRALSATLRCSIWWTPVILAQRTTKQYSGIKMEHSMTNILLFGLSTFIAVALQLDC